MTAPASALDSLRLSLVSAPGLGFLVEVEEEDVEVVLALCSAAAAAAAAGGCLGGGCLGGGGGALRLRDIREGRGLG